MEHLVDFKECKENILHLPKLRKIVIGIRKKGLLFLHNIDGAFSSTFVKVKLTQMVHANADIEPEDKTKSLDMIQKYGFYEYILCVINKNTMVAIDPDSHFFMDYEDRENPKEYIP
jgi:hypothetical protein